MAKWMCAALSVVPVLFMGCGSLPRVPVQGTFLGHELKTTVDSETARYFVESYLPGHRMNPDLDARIERILNRHRGIPERDELGRISDSTSPDFAALYLAYRLQEVEENRDLQARFHANAARLRSRLKAGEADSIAGSGRYLVLLVPGWDYRSNGNVTGSNLAQPQRLLTRVGLANRLVEIDPVGSVEKNAKDVAEAVARAQDAGKSLILVGPSSAGPAIHLALGKLIPEERRGVVKAWVNLGGILQGSPLLEYLQAWPRSWLFGGVIWIKGWNKADVMSMSATKGRERFRSLALPPHLFIMNYVGVSMSGELSKYSRDKYPILRKWGPNDGLTLLTDILAPGSRTLLALGSDHFFAEDPEIDLKTVAMAHTIIQILEGDRTDAVMEFSGTPVTPVGAMREVMWGSRMEALLDLDTLSNRQHLYGLGPLDSLRGELLIAGGKAYRSTVGADGRIKVEETFASKAPFFVFSRVAKWRRVELPDSMLSLPDLEPILDQSNRCRERPCTFRLAGKVRKAGIHVVNLPPGTPVKTPADAHRGLKSFPLANAKAEMVGYFSTRHQGVFTHHGTFVHIHMITADRELMGHLDQAEFHGGEMELFLAEE